LPIFPFFSCQLSFVIDCDVFKPMTNEKSKMTNGKWIGPAHFFHWETDK